MWRVIVCTVLAEAVFGIGAAGQVRFALPAGVAPVAINEFEEGPVLITRFVIDGTSADEWTSAFEILEISRKGQPKTAKEWFEAFNASGEEHCPGGEWSVELEDETSVLYERQTGECDGNPPQHSLNRVLYGKKKLFVLVFTSSAEMPEDTRDTWLTILTNASAK